MGFSDTMRYLLSVLLIIFNVLGFAVGIVLMSLAAWMYVGYAYTPSLHEAIYGVDIFEVLVFFITSGAFLAVLSLLGLLAGVFSLMRRARCFAAALLLLYSSLLFALYTFQVISVSLDFSQFFEGKDKINATVMGSFSSLLSSDAGLNSSSAETFKAWQSKYMCCGWLSGVEYASSTFAKTGNNTDFRPESCCGARNTTMYPYCTATVPGYYTSGCDTSFVTSYYRVSWAFIGMSVSAAVIEALVLAISFFLIGLVRCSGRKAEEE